VILLSSIYGLDSYEKKTYYSPLSNKKKQYLI